MWLLVQAVVDPDRGTAAQIAGCNYNVKEPATRYQPWAEALVKQYRAFNDFMTGSDLPQDVKQKVCMLAWCTNMAWYVCAPAPGLLRLQSVMQQQGLGGAACS